MFHSFLPILRTLFLRYYFGRWKRIEKNSRRPFSARPTKNPPTISILESVIFFFKTNTFPKVCYTRQKYESNQYNSRLQILFVTRSLFRPPRRVIHQSLPQNMLRPMYFCHFRPLTPLSREKNNNKLNLIKK